MIAEKRGSVVLLDPESPEEREWLADRKRGTWFDGMLVVEPGFVPPLARGARRAGYQLRGKGMTKAGRRPAETDSDRRTHAG